MDDREGITRRDFMRSMAAAAVGAGVTLSAVETALAQEGGAAAAGEPFRVGLIGCGSQGGNVLLPNAKRVKDIRVVAVCDIVEERRNGAAKRAGEGVPAFTEYKEMLEKVPMDAVIVATPLWMHSEMTVAALQAGFHVFCEKCMAHTVDQCKDMLRAQKAAGKILQIGHHLRYHPLYWHAKRTFVDKGVLGDIKAIYAQWNRNRAWRNPVIEGDYTKWGYDSPEKLSNWRLYKQYSGGLMTELGSHQIDAVTWMLGKNPLAVTGVGGIDVFPDGRTVFDNVHVTFEYEGGAKFDYRSILSNQFSLFGNECHEVIQGTKGTLVMTHLNPDPLHGAGWFFLEPNETPEIWMEAAETVDINGHTAIHLDATVTEGPKLAGQPLATLIKDKKTQELAKMTYQLEFEEFVISCREGRVPSCDGNIGMRSAAEASTANQAMEAQARVPISEEMFAL